MRNMFARPITNEMSVGRVFIGIQGVENSYVRESVN